MPKKQRRHRRRFHHADDSRNPYANVKLKGEYPESLKVLPQYLHSEWWFATRARYYASPLPKRCLICEGRSTQLHHTRYDRLGREKLSTLRPLCKNHHDMVHQTIRRFNMRLRDTDEAIRYVARDCGVMDMSDRLAPFYQPKPIVITRAECVDWEIERLAGTPAEF